MAITLDNLPSNGRLLFEIFAEDGAGLGIASADEIRDFVAEGIFPPTITCEPVMRRAFVGGAWQRLHLADPAEVV